MCSVGHDSKQHGDSSGGVPAPLPVRTVPTLTVTVLLPAEAFRQLYHCGVSQQGTRGEVPAEWCSLTHLPLNIHKTKCGILGSRKTRLQPVGSKREVEVDVAEPGVYMWTISISSVIIIIINTFSCLH